jgi:thiol:disulfide interchange protein DsbD
MILRMARLQALLLIALFVVSTSVPAQPKRATLDAQLNFKSLHAGDHAIAAIVLNVAEGFHAQSHTPLDKFLIPLTVKIDANPAIEVAQPQYPEPLLENYPQLGPVSVYTGKVTIYVPIEVKANAPLGALTIKGSTRLQICDDKACFQPETRKFEVSADIIPPGQQAQVNSPELFSAYHASATSAPTTAGLATLPPRTNATKVTEYAADPSIDLFGHTITLGKNAYAPAFFFAFLVGIIFNIMPCVLPVLPLKAIGFYEVSQHNRAKSLALGLVFSLGLVASFAVLGLLVIALQVFKWGELFSNMWFLSGLVVVLVVMGLSMFGVFTVNLPTSVYRFTPRHDTYTGNFLFGILTAALSTPCTFGMFFFLLAWALSQPPQIGVLLMIVVGIGMAFPYFLLSAFPELARRFPRSGPWAETVKQLMGFLLLGTAAYFAGPFIEKILGENSYWWVIFAIIVVAGIFLIWRTWNHSRTFVPRAIAVFIALAMVLPSFYVVRLLTAKPYAWLAYTPERLAEAQNSGKIVLIDFTAIWCGNCHWVETFVLNSRRIVKTVDDHQIVMLKADLSDDTAPGRPLLNQLNPVGAIPLTAIYSPSLKQPIQLNGIYQVQDLEKAITQAAERG